MTEVRNRSFVKEKSKLYYLLYTASTPSVTTSPNNQWPPSPAFLVFIVEHKRHAGFGHSCLALFVHELL